MFVINVYVTFDKEYEFWFLGTIFRRFFLGVVRKYDEELANYLHSPPKNTSALYSIELPFNKEYKVLEKVHPNRTYIFKVKVFSDDLYTKLVIAFSRFPEHNKFRDISFRVIKSRINKISISDLDLSIKKNKVKYYFVSPTVFKPMGSRWLDPIPTPQKIFRSAAKLWNDYIQNEYSKEEVDSYANNTKIVGLNLHTAKPIDIGRNRKVIGTMGYLVMDISELSEDARKILRFSEITNIGKNRTYGMGLTRIVPINRSGDSKK